MNDTEFVKTLSRLHSEGLTGVSEMRDVLRQEGGMSRVITLLERGVEAEKALAKKHKPKPTKQAVTCLENAERNPVRGTRWDADRLVPEDWITEARANRESHNLPVIDLWLEAETFANYWASKPGKDATKVDWHKTWSNWALRARGNGKSTVFQSAGERRDDAARSAARDVITEMYGGRPKVY